MPPLVNDDNLLSLMTNTLSKSLGEGRISDDFPISMGCEEFSVYLDHVPGVFMFIGTNKGDGGTIEIHNPKFLFPEELFPISVKALVETALAYLDAEY